MYGGNNQVASLCIPSTALHACTYWLLPSSVVHLVDIAMAT
jgi:hypothetical protein